MSPSAMNTTARNRHRIQNNDNNHQERKASNAEIQHLLAQPDAANDGGNLREPGEYPVHSNAWGADADEPEALSGKTTASHALLRLARP